METVSIGVGEGGGGAVGVCWGTVSLGCVEWVEVVLDKDL